MPLWQRLMITLAAMLVLSFIVGQVWLAVLAFELPSYIGGLIGGGVAVPVWEFLKRIKPKI